MTKRIAVSAESELMGRLWYRTLIDRKTGCWEWQGSRNANGYGVIRNVGSPGVSSVHRAGYQVLVGPIPTGFHVHHECANRACWNPANLTTLDPAKHRAEDAKRVTHCPQGHPYDEVNTRYNGTSRLCVTCSRERHKRRTLELAGECVDCGVALRSRTAKRCQPCHLANLHGKPVQMRS